MQPTIFLFDVDGVLIRPGGYREAVRATVNFFTRMLGLGDLAPDDETVAIFEAQGITCEWDMVPALLAVALDAALKSTAVPESALESLEAAQTMLQGSSGQQITVDYASVLRRLGSYTRVGTAPADCFLEAGMDGNAADLFPNLTGQGVLKDLFADSRVLNRSRTTAVFETFALGDQVYTQSTGLPVEVQSESLLSRYDQPLLIDATRDRLLALRSHGKLSFAAYTARPSLPSTLPDERLAVYIPEAEMALGLLEMDPFPLVGSGQLGEAASRLKKDVETLIKPAPYHALAAIATACSGDQRASLDWMEWVYRFLEEGERESRHPFMDTMPSNLHVHIFEDSPSGMRGGKQAVELLGKLGIHVELHLWGITTHVEKATALRIFNAQVFADVNQAVAAALQS